MAALKRILPALLIFLFAQEPSSAYAAPILLCNPERMWRCNGLGECVVEERPETLAGWKIDTNASTYQLCSRSGSDCGDPKAVSIGSRSFSDDFYVIHDPASHPETIKYDPETGKFASVRISGGFQIASGNLKFTTDISAIEIVSRVGSCVEVGQ